MEPTEDYENLRKFCLDGEGHRPRNRKPERGVRPAEPVQGKRSPRVLYTLLGLCILLSVLTLGIAVILMSQMLSEVKRLDAGFREELSKWKSNDSEVINAIAELQSEISHRLNLSPDQSFNQWRFTKHSLYYFALIKTTWDKAQEFCASMGSNLVIINSGEEQEYIRGNRICKHWIGLSDTDEEGKWRWVDGTELDSNVKFWASGEPNGARKENCAVVNLDGSWNDLNCSSNNLPICEKAA